MASKKVYFNGLNVLRFIAALAVLIFHSSEWYHYRFDTPFKMLLHNLPVAVDFFFIISGFLIIYLLMVEREKTGTISLKNFYIRRFLRIFPLYYLVILLAYLFFQTDHDLVAWHKFLYFTGNFWMIFNNAWTLVALNPLWSINIEEHFYLVVPFLILITKTKYLKYLMLGIIVASVVFRVYATVTVPNNWMTIYMHTFSQMDLLAIGGLLAYYHFKHPIRFKVPVLVNVLILTMFILLLTLVDTKDYTSVYFAGVKKYLFAIPMVFIIVLFIFNDNPALKWIKEAKWLNYFGKISYGIYMYNAMVIHVLAKNEWLQMHYAVKLLLDILLTLAVAALSYELFEKQFLKLKNRFQRVASGRI